MERGFKASAVRLALEIRSEFGLGPTDPFDPYAYFSTYGIPVVGISELEAGVSCLLSDQSRDKISGALIPLGSGFVVIDNDSHPMTRRRSTAAHECAHHALEHEFAASISADQRACGLGKTQEDEANELAGELLVPSKSAKSHAVSKWSDDDVAEAYGVSVQFAAWRMNANGARKYAKAVQRRRSA